MDRFGNAVAVTTTLNFSFGSEHAVKHFTYFVGNFNIKLGNRFVNCFKPFGESGKRIGKFCTWGFTFS